MTENRLCCSFLSARINKSRKLHRKYYLITIKVTLHHERYASFTDINFQETSSPLPQVIHGPNNRDSVARGLVLTERFEFGRHASLVTKGVLLHFFFTYQLSREVQLFNISYIRPK